MKYKIIVPIIIAILLTAALKIGYYESFYGDSSNYHFFVKKAPTLQLEFRHIFANDGDHKEIVWLRPDEREAVINYCRHRIGIDTKLETQADLDACVAL